MSGIDIESRDGCFRHALDEEARPDDVDVVNGERASEERPVGLEETQHARDRDRVVGEHVADALDLPLHAVDEFRSVATVDAERFHTRSEDAAHDAD